MSGLFAIAKAPERSSSPETTQAAYVEDLVEHLASIPDLSKVPAYYSLTHEESVILGQYCRAPYGRGVTEGSPLFRDDIIDPDFCRSVDTLTRRIAGNRTGGHWYEPVRESGDSVYKNYLADAPQAKWTSRRWEIHFVNYMRQRRGFHVTFMGALLTGGSIDAAVKAIGLQDGQPVQTPSVDPYKGGQQPAPELMYNRTNWLTASLLSALALPPELCDAAMKRHAIEQWALRADVSDRESLQGFYELDKVLPPRLPWSMRSNAELHMNVHPQWRQNPIVKNYLGETWNERADGLEALLQERPKDYVQILILQTFTNYLGSKGLRNLVHAAGQPSEVKDIIFAEDAAVNTVYGAAALPEYGQPTSLVDLLSNEEITAQTQETIIAGQRLRIHVLEQEAAAAQRAIKKLTDTSDRLATRNTHLEKALADQQPHLPRSSQDLLLLEYGISPAMDAETLQVVVAAIRRDRNSKFHRGNKSTEEEEKLKEFNANLDAILRARGLRNRE